MKDFITSLPGRIVIITALLIILGGVVLYVVIRSKVGDAPEDPSEETQQVVASSESQESSSGAEDNTKTSEVETSVVDEDGELQEEVAEVDAKEYYQQTATQIKIIEVADSADVMTEATASNNLTERGFNAYPITYEYDMSGKLVSGQEEMEITPGSEEKHPTYQTAFHADNGETWMIYVINGVVMANPLSYNFSGNKSVATLVSESEWLTSYDSHSNSFYETVPKESEVRVIVVPKIDAETLNKLTSEEMDKR